MKKSAKQLIDNLIDAVQNFDSFSARSGYSESAVKRSRQYQEFTKAKRELRAALLSKKNI